MSKLKTAVGSCLMVVAAVVIAAGLLAFLVEVGKGSGQSVSCLIVTVLGFQLLAQVSAWLD